MYTYTHMKTSRNVKDLRFAIVATDIVLLRNNDGILEYATQTVNRPPHYDGIQGFLGGVLNPEETSCEAAERIIQEKSKLTISNITFLPLGFYDAVDRDLRGRVVSLAHIGIVENADNESGLTWHPLYTKSRLAYDHNTVLKDTIEYIQAHIFITVLALYFLPARFIVSELKNIFDYVQGEKIDKRNFYKFLATLPIEETKEIRKVGRGRPAIVYKKKVSKGFFLHRDTNK